MFKICALNNLALENDDHEDSSPFWEVLEASAAKIHQDAITYLANNKLDEAKECFLKVLDNPFVNKVSSETVDSNAGLTQERALKYSSLKNVGGICMKHKNYEEASKYYLQAVHLDASEVLIWQKLGIAAIRSRDFELALSALQEGLKINPNHWPCLDQLLSVLFLLGFQEDCLGLCIKMLQKDPYYVKALAFRDRIFKDQPHIVEFIKSFYLQSDILFVETPYDTAKGDKFIANCLELRPKPKERKLDKATPPKNVCSSLRNLSWEELGLTLKQMYDDVIDMEAMAFASKVDLEDSLKNCLNKKFGIEEVEETPVKKVNRSLSYDDNKIGPRSLDDEQNIGGSATQATATPKAGGTTIEVCDNLVDGNFEKMEEPEVASVTENKIAAVDGKPDGAEGKTELKDDIVATPVIEELRQPDATPVGDNCKPAVAVANSDGESKECRATDAVDVHKNGLHLTEESHCSSPDVKTTDGDDATLCTEGNQSTAELTEVKSSIVSEKGDMSEVGQEDSEDKSKSVCYNNPSTVTSDKMDVDPQEDDINNKVTAEVNKNESTDVPAQPTSMEVPELLGSPRITALPDLVSEGVASLVEEIGQFFTDVEMNFISADNMAGNLPSDGERNSASDPDKIEELDSCSKDSGNSSDGMNDRKNVATEDPKEKDLAVDDEKNCPGSEVGSVKMFRKTEATTSPIISPKKSSKKPKRMKRGLERELEQLDYWGRREAREAKRRRKTITSTLVGVFEDGEYLSLNHLFRGFIPAALICSEDTNKDTTPKKYKEGIGLCSSIKPVKDESSSVKRKLPFDTAEEVKPSQKRIKVCHNDALAALGDDEKKFVNDMIDKTEDKMQPAWTVEEFHVTKFISSYKYSFNILDLILVWETTLINFYGKVWPKNVASCFNDIYLRGRNHVWQGLDLSESPKRLIKLGTTALTNLELAISIFLSASENPDDSEKVDIRKKLETDLVDDDLLYLGLLSGRCDLWNEDFLQFNLRVRWIQAQISLIKRRAGETAIVLQILLNEIQLSCRDDEDICIGRCRIDGDSITVNSSQVQYQLIVLQRSNMLEGVSSKFESGCYDEVVQVLSATFDKSTPMVSSSSTNNCPSRRTQLMLLIKALSSLNDHAGIVDWSGACLAEAIQHYKKLPTDDEQLRRSWSESISKIIQYTYDSFVHEDFSVKNVGKQSLSKLVGGLMEVIVLQLEQNANLTHLYFGSVVPWILLHVILSGQENNRVSEDSEASNSETKNNNESSKEQTFSSALFLITAHEELGKNGWCGLELGKLLIYTCDILIKELSRPLSQEQYTVISRALDQITYCLYSHPQRRTKHKHLRDHGIQPVLLSWTEAKKLYSFYYPSQLPDFQSSDIPSINEDLTIFIKRFISLYPEKFNSREETKKVEQFLDSDDQADIYTTAIFSKDLEHAHYLIADYHFKNKEWDLAIDYYKQDVAINVTRLESWAAMGLSKKAQLETLLNSCDVIKNLNEFFKKSQVAIRCLNRALVLDKLHYNLWVEKGALLFMTHSHASRTLKQDINPLMSMELFGSLERIKSKSLEESKTCFNRAIYLFEEETDDSLPDERWLYHYMLGKAVEKDGTEPQRVIDCYIKSFDCLHHAGAKYPARISYNNPQENSIEALEIYFRVFAYILKYLTHKEDKPVDESDLKYFHFAVTKFSNGPFATQKENKTEKQDKGGNSPETDGVRCFVGKVAENVVSLAIEKTFATAAKKEEPVRAANEDVKITVREIVDKCLTAMKLCMTRFPHHYKSLYRISHYYYHSTVRNDVVRARNYILGCQHWQRLDYMPVNGLFNDRKVFLQNPRTCNFFNGVWRIPNDEIDRPGSFAAHMYKCICMLLEMLRELKDFFSIFEIAFSLKFSPDKDKKYLRDNERELLSEHAIQVGIQSLKDKYQQIFQNSSPANFSRQQSFLLEVYKSFKFMSRHLSGTDALLSKLLVEAYAIVNNVTADTNAFMLREAEAFCARYLSVSRQQLKPQNASSMNPMVPGAVKRGRPPGPAKFKNSGKFDSQFSPVSSQIQAVQQAYKVYENLAQAQTLLTSKNVDPKVQQHHQKICTGYQKQLMQYLQIPSVSRYFSSSLQSLGSAPAKIPPPGLSSSPAKPPPTESSNEQSLLSSLAAKSQVHGVSITTASRKETQPPVPSTPVMSITVTSSRPKTSVDAAKPTVSSSRSTDLLTNKIAKNPDVTITTVPSKPSKYNQSRSDVTPNEQKVKTVAEEVDSDITFIIPPDPLLIDDQSKEQNLSSRNEDDIIILD